MKEDYDISWEPGKNYELSPEQRDTWLRKLGEEEISQHVRNILSWWRHCGVTCPQKLLQESEMLGGLLELLWVAKRWEELHHKELSNVPWGKRSSY